MGKHYCDAKARCPYYRHEDHQVIYCEGVQEDSTTHVAFADRVDCREYKSKYCRSCWQNCRIAQMLGQKYEDEDNGK